jgi:hypothetical protein
MQATALRVVASLLGLGALALATAASACEPNATAKSEAPAAASGQVSAATSSVCDETVANPETPAAQAGMRVFIDPETGTIGVPAVMPPLAAADKAALAPLAQPVQTVLPDGSVMMELNGACQEYMVLQVDAQGKKSLRCVQDPKLAASKPAAAPQPQDR